MQMDHQKFSIQLSLVYVVVVVAPSKRATAGLIKMRWWMV